jgi:hypothetical protein
VLAWSGLALVDICTLPSLSVTRVPSIASASVSSRTGGLARCIGIAVIHGGCARIDRVGTRGAVVTSARTIARERIDAVSANAVVLARRGSTVVDVGLALIASEACVGTGAMEAVHHVDALAIVLAWGRGALVDIRGAIVATPASITVTRMCLVTIHARTVAVASHTQAIVVVTKAVAATPTRVAVTSEGIDAVHTCTVITCRYCGSSAVIRVARACGALPTCCACAREGCKTIHTASSILAG